MRGVITGGVDGEIMAVLLVEFVVVDEVREAEEDGAEKGEE